MFSTSSLTILTCCGLYVGLSSASVVIAEPATVVVTNVESMETAVAPLRITGEKTRRVDVEPRSQRVLLLRPGQSLEFAPQRDWQAIAIAADTNLDLQIDRRGDGTPAWSVRRYERELLLNSVSMKLVPIPAGNFRMGSRVDAATTARRYSTLDSPEQAADFVNEQPVHPVMITRPFYISAHEVTVGQFRVFVDDSNYLTDAERDGRGGGIADPNDATFEDEALGESWRTVLETWQNHAPNRGPVGQSEDIPISMVTWDDAMRFCKWLSAREDCVYRLPTEAEWEYVCRAGTEAVFSSGDDVRSLRYRANVPDQERLKCVGPIGHPALPTNDGYCSVAPVGSYQPNEFGVFDMHGNVWEWCLDRFDPFYYRRSPAEDPLCNVATADRALRGGCFL